MKRIALTKGHMLSGIILILISVFFLMWVRTKNYNTIYTYNIFLDIFYLVICGILLIKYADNREFDILDPIYFVSAIYLTMFFITPVYDILIGNYYWFGYSLFEYGPKASTIAFIGYLAMYLFISKEFRIGIDYPLSDNITVSNMENKPKDSKMIMPIIYVMYAVAFIANVYYLVNSGYGNLTYILTLGLSGSGNIGVETNNIGFVSMLSYSLPTIVLLVWEYSNSKFLKIVLFVPMFMLQVARGYRFFVIQIVVTFIAYYYLKNKSRPKLKLIIMFILIMMVFILIMTIFRNAIRGGEGINISMLNGEIFFEALDEAFWDNLRIYQNVYGMVGVIPNEYPYVGMRQILIGTLIMTIPRAIWPNKISSYGGESLRVLIGGNLAAGQAYPTIGEYYYAFGILGVCFFMAVFGGWLKKLRNYYMYSNNPLDTIYFSIMLGCCLQLIIRGYFPSNFWYLFFAVLPVWGIRMAVKWE